MAETLVERAWAWLHATFPERQIYIRSEGRVQFFTFGSTLQATCAGLSLIFLGWVAFASVNVIFKDRIIAAKDHRYQQMQGTYEGRVADLQSSYDELNNALVAAEDQFKSAADELEVKQQTVAKLLGQKQSADTALASISAGSVGSATGKATAETISAASGTHADVASDSLGTDAAPPPASSGFAITPAPQTSNSFSGSGASQLNVMPEAVEPQPRTARPNKASFLDDAVSRFADALFRSQHAPADARSTNDSALHVLTDQTSRIKRLSSSETSLLAGLDQAISGRIGTLHGLLQRVGVNADALEREASAGEGGPLIPMQSVHIDGISDNAFTTAYAGAIAHSSELDVLMSAVHHVPLTTPVHGSQFELTSGFGPRIDPFTRHVAFHPGVDFAGPWGSTVVATAPGVVVWAGARGGYGNLVEIDHGYGFHTRYGHLSSILVRVGTRVGEGTPVGKLGSTGRSTGPHVHYEVWLSDKLRDPSNFIEAGRHVFE